MRKNCVWMLFMIWAQTSSSSGFAMTVERYEECRTKLDHYLLAKSKQYQEGKDSRYGKKKIILELARQKRSLEVEYSKLKIEIEEKVARTKSSPEVTRQLDIARRLLAQGRFTQQNLEDFRKQLQEDQTGEGLQQRASYEHHKRLGEYYFNVADLLEGKISDDNGSDHVRDCIRELNDLRVASRRGSNTVSEQKSPSVYQGEKPSSVSPAQPNKSSNESQGTGASSAK